MDRDRHVEIADSEGFFYCKAVEGVLNYKREEQVCGKGCPYYAGDADGGNGKFVCCYCEKDESDRLYKAYRYAAAAHAGQFRKGTKIPYMAHLIMTVNYAFELTDDIEILQAAVLHDTVEDTWVTFEDLQKSFGHRVAELVAGETENKRRSLSASETWEIRKREAVEQLGGRSLDVKKIVLADKTANLNSIVRERKFVGEQVWNKFNQKDKRRHEWYFRSIRERLDELNDTSVIKLYDAYLDILFGG